MLNSKKRSSANEFWQDWHKHVKKGVRLGRPQTAARMATEITELNDDGISQAEIARRLPNGRTSVRHILADAKQQ